MEDCSDGLAAELKNICNASNCGAIIFAEGNMDKANIIFKNIALSENPLYHLTGFFHYNMPPMSDMLARTYQGKGNLDKAIEEYKRLTNFNPASKDRRLIHPRYHYRLLYH